MERVWERGTNERGAQKRRCVVKREKGKVPGKKK